MTRVLATIEFAGAALQAFVVGWKAPDHPLVAAWVAAWCVVSFATGVALLRRRVWALQVVLYLTGFHLGLGVMTRRMDPLGTITCVATIFVAIECLRRARRLRAAGIDPGTEPGEILGARA